MAQPPFFDLLRDARAQTSGRKNRNRTSATPRIQIEPMVHLVPTGGQTAGHRAKARGRKVACAVARTLFAEARDLRAAQTSRARSSAWSAAISTWTSAAIRSGSGTRRASAITPMMTSPA